MLDIVSLFSFVAFLTVKNIDSAGSFLLCVKTYFMIFEKEIS
jgi:hypothetical protein